MAATALTVVSGDVPWMRALEAGLRTRGFDALVLPTEEDATPLPLAPRPIALLIDAKVEPYGATELATQLRMFLADRCPALVCMGDPDEPPADDLFAGRCERPDDPEDLLDELARLIPMVTGLESGVADRRLARQAIEDETG